MKAYQMGPQDGLASLNYVERPDPVAGANEILVRVTAACLNHRDLLALRGQYGPLKAENRVPLSDGVGEIVAVGDGVTDLKKGQRVIAPHFATWRDGPFTPAVFAHDLGMSADGWLADYIVLPASSAILVPDLVTDHQAATLAAAGATVWHCINSFGKMQPGDLVLTLGTGGVSIFTLQIAKALGATVAITSSSDDKRSKCRDMGADITINYRDRPDWDVALMEESGGKGADVIVETAGFATLEKSIAAAAPNGRIALIGGLAGAAEAAPNMFGIIGKNLTLKGITSGSRAMLADVLALVAKSGMIPLVDQIFDFDDAPLAFSYLDSGSHMGKVMISV